MAITAAMIKELREITGAGMSTCKEALVEADGNIEKAIEILREKGLATAAKKSGRIAAEGLSYAYITEDNKVAVLVEVNSETDFVAKNEVFRSFVEDVAQQVVSTNAKTVEELLEDKWIKDESNTVSFALNQNIATIGENLTIRRFEKVVNSGNSLLVSYIHAGGKVAVLVEFETTSRDEKLVEAGKNVAMQIAAMNPDFLSKDDVPQQFIQKETEILTQQIKNDPSMDGKPANIIEKMVEGRLNKTLKERCLLEQEYVKAEEKESVGQYVASIAKQIGADVKVKNFVRYETGDGIEKKEENFAEEVSKAMQG